MCGCGSDGCFSAPYGACHLELQSFGGSIYLETRRLSLHALQLVLTSAGHSAGAVAGSNLFKHQSSRVTRGKKGATGQIRVQNKR